MRDSGFCWVTINTICFLLVLLQLSNMKLNRESDMYKLISCQNLVHFLLLLTLFPKVLWAQFFLLLVLPQLEYLEGNFLRSVIIRRLSSSTLS